MRPATGTARYQLRTALIWFAFAVALVLTTAPAWRWSLFGFAPTLDQALQLAICGGRLPR